MLDFSVLAQPETWLLALIIFLLRVVNMATDTLRLLMIPRGRKAFTWVLGFVQSVIFVIVLNSVVGDLTNILSIVAYAGGFATGNVIGMWIEERMAVGFIHLRVISVSNGYIIAEKLRDEGYAVTEVTGWGKDGRVSMLEVGIRRKQLDAISKLISEHDKDAFITTEDLRSVRRGFWGK